MSTPMKRFTISITPSMEKDLNELKKEKYYNKARSEMIRDLLKEAIKGVK